MPRPLVTVALGALLAVSAACGGGSGDKADGDKKADAVATEQRSEEVPMELTVKMDGDLQVTLDRQKVKTRIAVLRTSEKAIAKVYGIETIEPVKVGNVAFIAGFGVTSYEGPGKYTIPEGSVYDAAQSATSGGEQPEIGSSVQVLWWATGDLAAEPQQFLRRAKPCTVEVKDGGDEGTLVCPDLTHDGSDKHFSLEMAWKVV